ncbi:MAG: DNA double-strand break repair nuclease NurA [Methanomicrobiales archaeon]|nr:DNA double-strand break repair nuclease NurA [Methanomicrobiales archaeon]
MTAGNGRRTDRDEYRRDLSTLVERIRSLNPPDLASRFAAHCGILAGSYQQVTPVQEGTVAAVDGSNAVVVESGSFSIAAVRAAACGFSDGARAFRSVTPLRLATLGREAQDRSFADLYQECFGAEPETRLSDEDPDRAAAVLRDTLEYWVALQAAERLSAGNLLVLDGALRVSHASHDPVLVRLMKTCAKRRVHLVAVTKRTAATWGGGFPLVPAAVALAASLSIPPPWVLPMDESRLDTTRFSQWKHGALCIAALHPRSPLAFKIEVPAPADQAEVRRIVSLLAGWSDDGRVTGYPYPLLDVHRTARIRADAVQQVKNDLMAGMGGAGLDLSRFRNLFGDYHGELERY